MHALLRILPLLVLIAAAIDTLLVRSIRTHREVDPALFLEACLLWFVFALFALPVAWLSRGLLRTLTRTNDDSWGLDVAALGGWLAFPVLAHQVLDRYTSIGQNVSALKSARPWLEVAGVAVAILAFAFLLAPRLRGVSGRIPALVALLGASGVGLFFGPSPDPPGSPKVAPEGAPNLLLLIWDTTRSMNLEPYGYDRATTPHLADLAEESVVFEEARSVSCFTLTSHLSMLTGVYPSHHGARLTRMTFDPRETPSLTRLLREHGYRTGGFVGTNVLRAGTGMVEGFEVYDDQVDPLVCDTYAWKLVHDVQAVLAKLVPGLRGNGNPHWFENFSRPAPPVLDRALDWIDNGDPRPWFCFVNLYDVHWPYLPGSESTEKWVRPYDGDIDGYLFRANSYTTPAGQEPGSRLTAADNQHLVDLYDAEMYELDRNVNTFLESLDLERSGTAVLITSDHGEAFGEDGTYEHNNILEPQVRIPFILVPPRGEAHPNPPIGRRAGRVSGIDVATTLAALARLEGPVIDAMTGIDVLAGVPDDRVILVEDRDKKSQRNTHYAVYRGSWKLVRTGVGPEATYELFDLSVDAVGEKDLSAEHPDVVQDLTKLLDDQQAAWGGDQENWEETAITDPGLKGLGYAGE